MAAMRPTSLAPALALALAGCDAPEPGAPASAAVSASAPAPEPPEPPEPIRKSFALFGPEGEPLVCYDITIPASKREAAEEFARGFVSEHTKELRQPCDSLGLTPLTTCHAGPVTTIYYTEHGDAQMKDCVSEGGRWERNAEPEADLVRAQRKLERMKR